MAETSGLSPVQWWFESTHAYFLEGEIETSKVALQKHSEGVRIHELVIKAFEKELKTLPEDPKEEEEECTPTSE